MNLLKVKKKTIFRSHLVVAMVVAVYVCATRAVLCGTIASYDVARFSVFDCLPLLFSFLRSTPAPSPSLDYILSIAIVLFLFMYVHSS